MGLLAPLAEFIIHEHKYKKIKGDALFIGRQTVFLDEEMHSALLAKHGLENQAEGHVEYDNETIGAQGCKYITDRYFMRSLGIPNVRFLDVTNYEQADIICDLGFPVNSALHESFDFIYNGGCLDNMFNPGAAIINMSRMLRPGGRIICVESASSWNSPAVSSS